MLPITQMLLTNHNRPKIKLKKLKVIVMHWTANTGKGANAVANRNYFNSTDRYCSAHYIVDDHQIIQCIPDNEVAYHVGANKYMPAGQKIMEGKWGPNFFTIGIEMCVNSDGNWDKTYQNAVELAANLLKKHGLSINNLYRHYDITGKDCPRMLLSDSAWNIFKSKVQAQMNHSSPQHNQYKKGEVIATTLNCREKPDKNAAINGKLSKGSQVTIYGEQEDWYLINNKAPQWVCRDYIKII
ncbi:SH3 domain-containing protein [Caloramator quimbayensis]|uniref:N-acetylmuramoyl-L-alanine amidase n=1 Tax=Caloramator quimbayensis TaxID=1147123 RepID=A0A1T4YD82_9CLOT|nr:N-acetylmuramoyl-L-alanine amidase [Caloramator quimbayensis]SKA99739.1 SH3 domain-containing protein [Caloramator quimbayensis]